MTITPPRGRADRQGAVSDALAQISLTGMLSALGPEWLVLPAVALDDAGETGHVLLGPAGVFTVATTAQAGRDVWRSGPLLVIDGEATGHLRIARAQGRRVAHLLERGTGSPTAVTPLVAVVGAARVTIAPDERADRVEVLTADVLVDWLTARPARLRADELTLLGLVADDARTWLQPMAADDPLESAVGLAALSREVLARADADRRAERGERMRHTDSSFSLAAGWRAAAMLAVATVGLIGALATVGSALEYLSAL